jgi:hypothetical protein
VIVLAAGLVRIPVPPRPATLDQPIEPFAHEALLGGAEVRVVPNQAECDDGRKQRPVEVVVHRGRRLLLEPAERVAFRPAREIVDHRAPRHRIVEDERLRRPPHHGPGEGFAGLLTVVDVPGDAVDRPLLPARAAPILELIRRDHRKRLAARVVPEQNLARLRDPIAFQVKRCGGPGETRRESDPGQRHEPPPKEPSGHQHAMSPRQSDLLPPG